MSLEITILKESLEGNVDTLGGSTDGNLTSFSSVYVRDDECTRNSSSSLSLLFKSY